MFEVANFPNPARFKFTNKNEILLMTLAAFPLGICHKKELIKTTKCPYCGIPDGRENVQLCKTSQRVNGLQGSSKCLMKYVADPSSTTPVRNKQENEAQSVSPQADRSG